MGLWSLFSGSSNLEPGDTIEVLDDSGATVEAIYKGKGKHARGRVVVTYTQGRYTGMDQYVERERVVGLVGKKAEPVLAYHRGWNQMKEVRKDITAAVLFTLATVGSALLYASIVLAMSDNRAIAVLIFFVALALTLPTEARRLRKQAARQKRKQGANPLPEMPTTAIAHSNGAKEQKTNPIPEAHMTVHGFIAHIKMHPELLPARMTEFDLERLRKVCSGKESQAEFGDWMKQLINSATVS